MSLPGDNKAESSWNSRFLSVNPGDATPRRLIYETSFLKSGQQVVDLLKSTPNDDLANLSADKKALCERRYQTILNDQKIDIRLAFGYMDWSTEKEIGYEGLNFGRSPSTDLAAYQVAEKFLLAPCQEQLQVCGFSKSPTEEGLYTKTVVIRGQTYPVELRMRQPSLTEFYQTNMQRKNEQIAKSEETRSFYMQALQDADLAIYMGHSRNGGGPDFYPPVLLPTGHPDYNGYYIPRQAGVKMMTEALTSSGHQAPAMSLMSCDSRNHFLQKLNSIAPHTGVISSTQLVTFDLIFGVTLSSVDALLRGQCQKSFYQEIRITPDAKEMITMDNMFE